MSNDLFYYLKQVQRRAGLTVSSAFPITPTVEQQLVMDSINERLRYLNNKHYLIFKQTEYTLTTTAGVTSYNLANAPYNQSYWRIHRLARGGVRRASDDWPLAFVDYTERDILRPNQSATADPTYYTSFGEDLILHPPPAGGQVKIRYYGLHIGTDDTGATQKMRLSETDDLTMLDDAWEDVLVIGAAMKVREQQKVDEKYTALKQAWEDWENILIDMGNQPGEDAGPQILLRPYSYRGGIDRGRYYPFFTDYPGGA